MAAAGDGDLSPARSKGKAKMDSLPPPEPEEEVEETVTCGICLADARRSIRGELDSCSHHFCFVCIMAWARVESRCPFCKLRFRAIHRPPVPGLFPSERVVAVAERNQVYHPLGNESSTVVSDPYANTSCSVCSFSKDDALLLLCELCDSAAHTYCVGLGATVPEGDWFCPECAASKEEHSKNQLEDEGAGNQDKCDSSIKVQRADPVVSIFDIVDVDYYTPNSARRTNSRSGRPRRQVEDLPSESTFATGSDCPESPREQDKRHRSFYVRAHYGVEIGARTLHNSRHLNNRIMALRKNWAALRAGSVGLSSHLLNSGKKNGAGTTSGVKELQSSATPVVNTNNNDVPANTSDVRDHQLCATPGDEQTTTSSSHGKKIAHKDTLDVCKAWKMMEMAKSTGGTKKSNKPASLNSRAPPFSMGNRATSCSLIDTILEQKKQGLSNEVCQNNIEKHDHGEEMKNILPKKNLQKCHSLPENHVSVRAKMVTSWDRMVNRESMNGKVGLSSHNQHVDETLGPSCSTSRWVKPKFDVLLPQERSLSSGQSPAASLQGLGPSAGIHCAVVNPEEPSASYIATANGIGSGAATVNVKRSSGRDRHKRKRKLGSETSDDQRSAKSSRSSNKFAKSEISLLAICELKLLRIDKTYGSDRFKEVARAVTHTVLAAWGLKHSPSVALALSRPVCKHSDKIKQLKSSVITDSCEECLGDFVKEVISSVLSSRQMDKTGAC